MTTLNAEQMGLREALEKHARELLLQGQGPAETIRQVKELAQQRGRPLAEDEAQSILEYARPSIPERLDRARYNSQDTYPKRGWVVEGIAALKALIMWAGPEKSWKSILALSLAMCIACGRTFYYFRIPKPRKVVYFDAEDPSEDIDARYKAKFAQFSPQQQALIEQNLTIVKGRELVNAGVNIDASSKEFWQDFRRKYPAEVYILDALQMFYSASSPSNEALKRTLLDLRSHCGPENCPIVLHHTRKREDREINRKEPVRMRLVGPRIWSDKLLGGGVLKRLPDYILCQELAEERNERGEVTDATVDFSGFGRIGEDLPVLRFREGAGDYTLRLVQDLSPELEESLLDLRAASGPWQSKNAAAKALMPRLSRSQANRQVNVMILTGHLGRRQNGEVYLVER